jgi:hypothetical protein
MKKEEIYLELFKFTRNTFYVWKRENRPIINLLEKYFSDEDLEEFLENEKISKLDITQKFIEQRNEKINLYIEFISRIEIHDLDFEIDEAYMMILLNYDNKRSFFQNCIKKMDEIELLIEEMIKKNIINVLEEIIYILIKTDLKILVEMVWYELDQFKRDSAVRQFMLYNVLKCSKGLGNQGKHLLYEILMNIYYEKYNVKNLGNIKPSSFYKEIEETIINF